MQFRCAGDESPHDANPVPADASVTDATVPRYVARQLEKVDIAAKHRDSGDETLGDDAESGGP